MFLLIICGSIPALKPLYDRLKDRKKLSTPYMISESHYELRGHHCQRQTESLEGFEGNNPPYVITSVGPGPVASEELPTNHIMVAKDIQAEYC